MSIKNKDFTILVLSAILLGSLFLNLWNNNFGLLHLDEGFKIGIILGEHKHDFHHPMLIMQAVKIPNAFLHYTDKLDVVRLGRTTSAVWGTLSVLFMFLIARRVLSVPFALLAAAGVAVSPTMVIHAHYLKEDMIFCCFALLCLWRYLVFVQDHSWRNAVWLGVATGFVLSTQYKAVLLVILFFAFPLVLKDIRPKEYYARLLAVLPLSLLIFVTVDYPMFLYPEHAWKGFLFTTRHAATGDTLKIYPAAHWFLWHFRYSLMDGMTPGIALFGAVGLTWSLWKWKTLANAGRVCWVYAVVMYLAVESSPMKAFPDYYRYVIPVVPVLVFFAFRGAACVWESRLPMVWKRAAAVVGVTVLLAWPLYDTVNLTYYINKDTRDQAQEWMRKTTHKVMCEQYVFPFSFIKRLADRPLETWQAQGFEYLVASKFMYEPYVYGLTLKGQSPEVYMKGKRYEELFSYPYEEIRPKYRSFAFSNPVIRIIDIRRKP